MHVGWPRRWPRGDVAHRGQPCGTACLTASAGQRRQSGNLGYVALVGLVVAD